MSAPARPVPGRHPAPATGDRLADRLGYGRGWLAANLPMVMAEDPFLARFVSIFEEVASTVRFGADTCADAADLTTASPAMLRFLAGWIGAPEVHGAMPIELQRRIVRAAGVSLRRRGTAGALVTLLEAVTGGPVEVDDPGGVYRDGAAPPQPVDVVVVRVASCGHLTADELVALVRDEVPAQLQIVVVVADEVVWPRRSDDEPASDRWTPRQALHAGAREEEALR